MAQKYTPLLEGISEIVKYQCHGCSQLAQEQAFLYSQYQTPRGLLGVTSSPLVLFHLTAI
ncbi:hypothetical protein [Propionimicrobium lymphophilum]|uniref:hypothetical protein n=1 Tax=Propionimicrobium lymphophilum TaxID=33012 RepID=UPI00288BF783|nr:hypothetical protein [Propionimicrobium lymphophilum]